jgi:hypothetical protein
VDARPFSDKVVEIKGLDAHQNCQENLSTAYKIHGAIHQAHEKGI